MKSAAFLAFALLFVVGCGSPEPEGVKPEAPPKSPAPTETSAALNNKAPEGEAKKASEADVKKAADMAAEATKIMNDDKLLPKDKYPKALEMYREALKIDPNNKEAKESAEMIESIYGSMGKPVPGKK